MILAILRDIIPVKHHVICNNSQSIYNYDYILSKNWSRFFLYHKYFGVSKITYISSWQKLSSIMSKDQSENTHSIYLLGMYHSFGLRMIYFLYMGQWWPLHWKFNTKWTILEGYFSRCDILLFNLLIVNHISFKMAEM